MRTTRMLPPVWLVSEQDADPFDPGSLPPDSKERVELVGDTGDTSSVCRRGFGERKSDWDFISNTNPKPSSIDSIATAHKQFRFVRLLGGRRRSEGKNQHASDRRTPSSRRALVFQSSLDLKISNLKVPAQIPLQGYLTKDSVSRKQRRQSAKKPCMLDFTT